MKLFAWVFAGAGIGAVARFAMQNACSRVWPNFPAGTFIVNLVGCLLMGILLACSARAPIASETRAFIGVGLLGGFTTFSAFSGESLALLQQGRVIPMLLYATGSAVGCIAACAAGFYVTQRFLA